MFAIKKHLLGIAIGIVLGLWMGVNIGKGKPIWTNPLDERAIADTAKAKVQGVIKDARRAVRESLKD